MPSCSSVLMRPSRPQPLSAQREIVLLKAGSHCAARRFHPAATPAAAARQLCRPSCQAAARRNEAGSASDATQSTPPDADSVGGEEEEEEEEEEADEYVSAVQQEEDQGPSAPDYSDYMNFSEDPPGHKAGFVAIIGRPNAGKSTLMNALLGQSLSIVTAKAQTTRHRVLGVWSEDAHQAVFLDTPGIIANRRDPLEERMMAAVDQSVRDSDALLGIIDAADRPEEALRMLQPGSEWKGPPLAIVLNKMDLLEPQEAEELLQWFKSSCNAAAVIPISAVNGAEALAEVGRWVVDHLPEGPSLYPKEVVADASERFFVSEIIRRQVFLNYRQELPYAVAVQVQEFKERRPPAKHLIRADVIVDKPRQRGIILGAGGSAIKALSTAARLEVEEFLGREVFLELSVKVEPGWRKDAAQLERLGY